MSEFYIVSNELYHHGILGQKWGVRRFQNPDGSLTAAGRERYGTGSSIGSKTKSIAKSVMGAAMKVKDSYEMHNNTKEDRKEAVKNFLASAAILTVGTAVAIGAVAGAAYLYTHGGIYLFELKLAAMAAMAGGTMALAGAGMMIDAAVSGADQAKAQKRYDAAETDPKTGFKLKPKETDPEDDAKKVNPGYHNFNDNTKNNCVLCSTAFEMRRRGYEMTAPVASEGWKKNPNFFRGEKHKDFNGSSKWNNKKSITYSELLEYQNQMSDWITKETVKQGNGARGELHITWMSGNGHSVAYEVQNNKLIIYDGQTGEKYKGFDDFKDISMNVSYARRDNLEFNTEELKRYGFK